MAKLEARNVTKRFKKNTAVDGLNVTFETGRVYGLLGRNSAGKTTLLKLLTTQYLPDSGEITYEKEAVYENHHALEKLCLFQDEVPAFGTSRIKHLLKMGKSFYKNWSDDTAEYLMEVFELKEDDYYNQLSKGKKTAVSIVLGMASGCEITMFDEVYSGLDAVARQKFYDLIREEYGETNRTFILSTHLIDEMSNLFTDVVIMKQGKVMLNEEMEALEASVISVRGTREQLQTITGVEVLNESVFAGSVTRIISGTFNERIIAKYKAEGIEVKRLSLQEIFIATTEHDGRSAK